MIGHFFTVKNSLHTTFFSFQEYESLLLQLKRTPHILFLRGVNIDPSNKDCLHVLLFQQKNHSIRLIMTPERRPGSFTKVVCQRVGRGEIRPLPTSPISSGTYPPGIVSTSPWCWRRCTSWTHGRYSRCL